jgi:hypothetical protein
VDFVGVDVDGVGFDGGLVDFFGVDGRPLPTGAGFGGVRSESGMRERIPPGRAASSISIPS